MSFSELLLFVLGFTKCTINSPFGQSVIKPQFYYIKLGFKGSKLYRYVFVINSVSFYSLRHVLFSFCLLSVVFTGLGQYMSFVSFLCATYRHLYQESPLKEQWQYFLYFFFFFGVFSLDYDIFF